MLLAIKIFASALKIIVSKVASKKKLLLAMLLVIQKGIASDIASNKLLVIGVYFCFRPCTFKKVDLLFF